MRWRVWVFLAVAATCGGAEARDGVTWYAITSDTGQPLGYASYEVAPHRDGREVIESQNLYLSEEGGSPTRMRVRTVTTEDASGRATSIVETVLSGRSEARTEVRVEGGVAWLRRETAAGVSTHDIPLSPTVRFDGGEALLRNWDVTASPQFSFDSFNLDAMRVDRIVFEAIGPRDGDGRVTASRRRYAGDALRGVARLVIDRDGRIVESVQPMFGVTFHVARTDRQSATRRHPPYQILPNAGLRSPVRIPASARSGHIRYRLAFNDGLTFALPQTGEQRVSASGNVTTLDICAACGPGLAADAEVLADALRPTPWLQSDHSRLRELAEPIARMDISDARKMEMLLERAKPFIENIDYNGHYSAVDTIVRRAGDCTEAAVLLAALGRAAGIPTRVASGFSYTRSSYHGMANSFVAHSWTLAYVDGAWRSFDLALLEFDSTHIALTIGDGDPSSIAAAAQLASLLRFDSLAEVRPNSGR
jgi:hypothetical protein